MDYIFSRLLCTVDQRIVESSSIQSWQCSVCYKPDTVLNINTIKHNMNHEFQSSSAHYDIIKLRQTHFLAAQILLYITDM